MPEVDEELQLGNTGWHQHSQVPIDAQGRQLCAAVHYQLYLRVRQLVVRDVQRCQSRQRNQ